MSYYKEARKARTAMNTFIEKLKPGDNVPISALVLAIVGQYEVGEQLARSHLKLVIDTNTGIELDGQSIRKVRK